jgi:predicted nucleic acid-binding protein
MFVLDTDGLIDVQRGHAAALAWFAGLTELPSVPGLVVMELIQGTQNARQVRDVLRLTGPLPVVWPTAADCQRVRADRGSSGAGSRGDRRMPRAGAIRKAGPLE